MSKVGSTRQISVKVSLISDWLKTEAEGRRDSFVVEKNVVRSTETYTRLPRLYRWRFEPHVRLDCHFHRIWISDRIILIERERRTSSILNREEQRTVQIGVVIFEVLPILIPLRVFVNSDRLSFTRRDAFVVRVRNPFCQLTCPQRRSSLSSTYLCHCVCEEPSEVDNPIAVRASWHHPLLLSRWSIAANEIVLSFWDDRSFSALYLGDFLVRCRIGDLTGSFRDFVRCLLRLLAEFRTEIRGFFQHITLIEIRSENSMSITLTYFFHFITDFSEFLSKNSRTFHCFTFQRFLKTNRSQRSIFFFSSEEETHVFVSSFFQRIAIFEFLRLITKLLDVILNTRRDSLTLACRSS